MTEPELKEVRVNYSCGVRANLGNYEHADVFLSKSESWNVSDEVQGEELFQERYSFLRDQLGTLIEAEYSDLKGA